MALGYDKFGEGAHRVIALHGWFGDQTTYAPMYEALTAREFTYVCPAYRGYGASKHLTGRYSIGEISADVIALADTLGFETFSLIGHSMGGMAVQRVLADAPKRVRRIVAITPVPASGMPFDAPTTELFESAVDDADNARAIVDFSTGKRLSQTWVSRIAAYPKAVASDAAFSAYLQSWSKTDFSAEIKGNPVPIRVIIGEHDPGLDAKLMESTYLAWYPKAELEVMSNSGHYPMNETPIALATSIEAFLRR
jgi:esterase